MTALRIGLVLIVVGVLVQQWFAQDVSGRRARRAADMARVMAAFDELHATGASLALPGSDAAAVVEGLPRARLRSVPVQRELSVVPPLADDASWSELMRAVDAREIPSQREAGEWS